MRDTRVLSLAWLFASCVFLSACATTREKWRAPLPPAGSPRTLSSGTHDYGSVEFASVAEFVPGKRLRFPTEITWNVDGLTAFRVEWMPFAVADRGGDDWEFAGSGELVWGLARRLMPSREDNELAPALSFHAFGVTPHGGRKPARWPGVVENQEGGFAVLAAEWGDDDWSLAANLGAGLGGRVGRPGYGGRVLGGLALTKAFGPTGIGLSTEPVRAGIETHWLRDPIDDRTFGELQLGVSFWVGSVEVQAGWRRGLTSETDDDVIYLGFKSLMFDAIPF